MRALEMIGGFFVGAAIGIGSFRIMLALMRGATTKKKDNDNG